MRARVKPTLQFLRNHRKAIRNIALIATGVIGWRRTCKTLIKKDYDMEEAYDKFREKIKLRKQHHSIQSLFFTQTQVRYFSFDAAVAKQKSIEPTTHLKADFPTAPSIIHDDGSSSELNPLSPMSWKEFIKLSSDEIYITFGHRKAFGANNPIRFTHAVLYISTAEGQHALYGYNSTNKNNLITNDFYNSSVSRDYTMYPDLTIRGNKKQVFQLLNRIEHFALQRYTAIGCNCYSPLISGLLETKKMGFHVPEDFSDSLLIVIPSEQNYGMGITANRYLKPLSDSAVMRTKQLFLEFKEKVAQKTDETIAEIKNKTHKPIVNRP